MVRLTALGLAVALLAGCGNPMKRLAPVELDHYAALRVYMDDAMRKEYLKLKTEEERDAWLKEAGLWERFYKYEPEMRERIVAGDVSVGWSEDRLFMSWSNPIDRRRLTGRPASRSEVVTYRFEVDESGATRVWYPDSKTAYKAVRLYEMDVYLDDRVITEISEHK